MEVNGVDELVVVEGYTLRETGEALGKSMLTIRSWIENQIIPDPFCWESSSGYQQYARFELDVIADILAEHEETSSYISTKDTALIEELWGCVEQVRAEFVDEAT